MRSSSHTNSSHQLRNLLAIGFGSSLFLHLGAIWTIARYWQPAATPEDAIEIALVEPIASVPPAPVQPTPAPKPIAIKPAIPITPKPQSISTMPPIATPPMTTAVKSTSKPRSTSNYKPLKFKLPSSAKPPVPAKPTQLQPRSLQTKLAAKPTPNLPDRLTPPPTSAFAFPRSPAPKPRAKPTPSSIDSPIPAKSARTTFDRPTLPPSQPNPTPTRTATTDRPISPTSDPVMSQPRSIDPLPTPTSTPITERPIAKNPPISTTPAPIFPTPTPLAEPPLGSIGSTGNLQQPKNPPKSIANPLTGGNNNLQTKQSGNSVDSDFKTDRGDRVMPKTGNSTATSDGERSGNPATANGNRDRQTGSDRGKTTTASNSSSGTSNTGLQCIKNCQIAKLQDLQDSDGGRDRLRIRVSIDANGIVTAAEIAKSSGNPQIDRTVLAGISQMQFQPAGKPIKGIIRANIFL